MGGRRSRRKEELGSFRRASVSPFSVRKRRTNSWNLCGVFLLLGLGLAACTESKGGGSPTRKILTIGFPEGTIAGSELGLGQLTTGFTLEGLTQVSRDGRALPRLAAAWTWENGGLSLRVSLREGVTFHDGTPLTASLIAELLSSAIKRPGNRALHPTLDDVIAVRPDGNLQLVIHLSQPSGLLPEDLDVPLGIGEENIGTGPFRFVRKDSSNVILERFDRYYLGLPEIEQIVIRPFDTLRTAWTSLLRGEVDMVTNVPHDAIEFVRNDAVEVISFERRYQFLIAFNSANPLFASSVVRRALNMAVNREQLIKNVLNGYGESATGPLWPKHWAYDASIQPYRFDPRLAMSLLDDAGFKPRQSAATVGRPPARLRFTCVLPADFSTLERVGLEVQKQLYEVGVDMQFQVVPFEEYDARIRDGRFEAVLVDMISGPTLARPYIFWRSAKGFRGLNVFGYENAEAEALFHSLRTSTNEATLRSTTHQLQRVLLDDPPALFLAWNERSRAVRREFQITDEPEQDPLLMIWRWTAAPDKRASGTR